MHCKIIALSTDSTKAGQEVLNDYTLSEWGFCPWIADYTDSDITQEYQRAVIDSWVDSLKEEYGDLVETGSNNESIIFHEGFRPMFADRLFTKVREYVQKNLPASLDTYNAPFFSVYSLESMLCDRFGLYICDDGSLSPVNRFFETVNQDEVYYFCNVVDYHY